MHKLKDNKSLIYNYILNQFIFVDRFLLANFLQLIYLYFRKKLLDEIYKH